MNKTDDFIEDINNKYSTHECALEKRLKDLLLAEQQLEKTNEAKRVTFDEQQQKQQSTLLPKCKNAAEARQRNANLIKELDISKARLRSRATYSPLEQELNKAIRGYNQQRSLEPVGLKLITRKVYGPTFV